MAKCFFRLFPFSFELVLFLLLGCGVNDAPKPNVIFVFADQWRAQDLGYNVNLIVKTPTLDQFARESVVFSNAAEMEGVRCHCTNQIGYRIYS